MASLLGRAACRSGAMVPATARTRVQRAAPRRHARTATPQGPRPRIRRTVAAAVAVPVQQTLEPETVPDFEDLVASYTKSVQNSQPVEHSYWVDPSMVEGEVPKELEGTVLRNGPGLFEIGGRKISQPFDGDGLVAAFSFKGGRVHFRNKFVRTKGFVDEQRAGRQLYRSAFNAGAPEGEWLWNPFVIDVKNIANTNVIHWGGKTLALYEVGRPHLLTPSLETVGEETFGDLLPEAKSRFGAHYRIIPGPEGGEQRLVAFNAVEAVPDSRIEVWEFDQGFQLLHKNVYTLPGAAWGFFHDIAATPQYYIFLENPITFSLPIFATRYIWGKACIAQCLEFDASKKVKIHLIPRPGAGPGAKAQVVETPAAFTFHHANAFEAAAGKVVLDTFCADFVDLGATAENTSSDYYRDLRRKYRMSRIVIDTEAGTAEKHVVLNVNSELPSVSPLLHGRPTRHTYSYCQTLNHPSDVFGPPQALAKTTLDPSLGVTAPFDPSQVTLQLWSPGPLKVAQEPIFVPRPPPQPQGEGPPPPPQPEDDGWVLTVVYDMESNTSSLAILDAQRIPEGPLCTIKLPHHLPPGLHGSFTPTFLGPADGEADPPAFDIRQGV